MSNRISYKNPDGYADPTAHTALSLVLAQAAQAEQDAAVDKHANALIKELKSIIRQNEFDLLARIEIKDRRTGRCYR